MVEGRDVKACEALGVELFVLLLRLGLRSIIVGNGTHRGTSDDCGAGRRRGSGTSGIGFGHGEED